VGSLYRPKYAPAGMTYAAAKGAGALREVEQWWMKYRDANGVIRRESSGTTNHADAKLLLKRREGRAAEGKPVLPRADKVTVGELLDDLVREYEQNGRRVRRLRFSLAHLRPTFGARKATSVRGDDINTYKSERLAAGAAPATVNRELAALKRAYTLGVRDEKIPHRPPITMLRENNARRGFFEPADFEALRAALPPALRPVVTFAYITGWRAASEILPLTWTQVDFAAETVRLEEGTTKSGAGRTFYMTPELRACLEAQYAARRGPLVFHRNDRPIKSFRKAWRNACQAAGLAGRIPHDFRRTAVRNLERAGVPQSTAMAMVGHKTASIYRRYAIVDETVLREGSAKLAVLHAGQSMGQSDRPDAVEVSRKLAEGGRFELPRASRPGGFQVHCLAS
jgi:integrase